MYMYRRKTRVVCAESKSNKILHVYRHLLSENRFYFRLSNNAREITLGDFFNIAVCLHYSTAKR